MEKYRRLCYLGRGSYGQVIKCRNEETGRVVAIKKIFDSDKDSSVKKIALREIRMLKKLKHDNLIGLIEVFQHRHKICLVFEFVEATLEDELTKHPQGLPEFEVKKMMWQVLNAVGFFHENGIIHRDIKPDNILISKDGIIKLCDLGFARPLDVRLGVAYTDYVATRWYRAPELLSGDPRYGSGVDTWAIGCVAGELISGQPMFSGSSDLDQLSLIVKNLGNLPIKLQVVFAANELFKEVQLPKLTTKPLFQSKFKSTVSLDAVKFVKACLDLNPDERPSCEDLKCEEFFTSGNFSESFSEQLRKKFSIINGVKKKTRKSSGKMQRRREDAGDVNKENFKSEESVESQLENIDEESKVDLSGIQKPAVYNCKYQSDTKTTTQSVIIPQRIFFASPIKGNSLKEHKLQKSRFHEASRQVPNEDKTYPYISGIKVPLLHPVNDISSKELYLPSVNVHYHFYANRKHNLQYQQNTKDIDKDLNLPNIFSKQ